MMDESVFALVSQLNPYGSVHEPTSVQLNSPLKMLTVLAKSEPNALRKPFLVLQDADQEKIDSFVLEVGFKGTFFHLIRDTAYEYFQLMFVLHCISLFLSHKFVFFTFRVLQRRQGCTFLKLDSFVPGFVPF